MKAFSPLLPLLLSGIFLGQAFLSPAHAEDPLVASPWAQLRTKPLFDAEIIPLAKTWGASIPPGDSFKIEKRYGRWIYGTPAPLKKMKPKDFAKPGWIYSRMMIMPGDKSTMSAELSKKTHAIIFHSQQTWRQLNKEDPFFDHLDFYDGLVLSENTMKAFSAQDEAGMSGPIRQEPFRWSLLSSAYAEENGEAPMGLAGADLKFLDQEFESVQAKHAKEKKIVKAKTLDVPNMPKLDDSIRTAILGRYMLHKYFEFPGLTHEEVDGNIYMRAIAQRSLNGCPKNIRDYWQKRRWNILRVYRLKSRPEEKNPWLQIALPGGYFAVSGRALDQAGNEAEMAFLLIRPFVRELRLEQKKLSFKNWPTNLEALSEESWLNIMETQNAKENQNLDVADEIAVNRTAIECISRGGYRPLSALSYMRKMQLKKEEPWSKWYFDHTIGQEYQIDRTAALMEADIAKQTYPEGKASNIKRFTTASRFWNILP